VQNALDRTSPKHAINAYRQRLDEILSRLDRSMLVKLEKKGLQLANLQQSLRGLSPRAVLNRGYAIVTREKDGAWSKVRTRCSLVKTSISRSAVGSWMPVLPKPPRRNNMTDENTPEIQSYGF
jgi:exonuclease VII large subunit